jgi:hypothetical protein
MRGNQGNIVILGILVILLSLMLPPVDLPGTPYNEADAPVNVLTVPAVQGHLQPPVSQPSTFQAPAKPAHPSLHITFLPSPVAQVSSHSVQSLLHILLC